MTTGPTQEAFAKALAADTGLSYTAALAWASAEVGADNNLGIMSGGQPVKYATPEAGAAAAAALIRSSPLYAGIVASTGGSVQQQLTAIAQSPWHLGPSGLAAAGGTDPYYANVFAQFGGVTETPEASIPTPAPTLESSTSQLTTQHWTTAQLAAGIATYEAIPAAQRTAKQSAALATDVATLAKDTELQQTQETPAEPQLTTTLPVTTPQAGQVVAYMPSVSLASLAPASAAPATASTPAPESQAQAPAATSSPLAGIDPTGLAALAIGALALVLFLSAPSGGTA